jgi:hypothetical protein
VVDGLAGQDGRVNVGALEPFVPIPLVVNDSPLDVFLPQGRAAIDAEAVESERIQLEPGAEAETLQDVLDGFAGRANQEEAMRAFDAVLLGFADRVFDFANVCRLSSRSRIFCVPDSTPNARKLQFALPMMGS